MPTKKTAATKKTTTRAKKTAPKSTKRTVVKKVAQPVNTMAGLHVPNLLTKGLTVVAMFTFMVAGFSVGQSYQQEVHNTYLAAQVYSGVDSINTVSYLQQLIAQLQQQLQALGISPNMGNSGGAPANNQGQPTMGGQNQVVVPDTAMIELCPASILDSFVDVQAHALNSNYADPELSVVCDDTMVYVSSNGIPNFEFVQTTPNALQPQDYVWSFAIDPVMAESSSDVPLVGLSAYSVNGLPIYGPTEAPQAGSRDPFLDEILDYCNGHTAQRGDYHFHARQECLADMVNEDGVIAYALDGFAVKLYDEEGRTQTSSYTLIEDTYGETIENAWDAHQYQAGAGDLDECNGAYDNDGQYAYYVTDSFPYFMGCYKGEVPQVVSMPSGMSQTGPGQAGGNITPTDQRPTSDHQRFGFPPPPQMGGNNADMSY